MNQPRKWTVLKQITYGTPACWWREKKPGLRRRARGARRSAGREPACNRVDPVQILVVVAITLQENAEGRSGVGFHVNSTWTWVSRS